MRFTCMVLIALFFSLLSRSSADELPPSLEKVILNPNIPMIVDVTITGFNKDGHAEIKVNKVYKAAEKVEAPKIVRGYLIQGATNKLVTMRILTDKNQDRYLLFLDGDLLHQTYNNRFAIQKKNDELVVNTGREWKPLKDVVALIPKK